MDELKYHYSNPKFEGKPWAVDHKPKRKKKQRRKKNRPLFNHQETRVREYLKDFWELFNAHKLDSMRLAQMACNPGWPRVDANLRKQLRKQFLKRYAQYLVGIGVECAICCGRPWKEKHHIVPLCFGGINDNLNLMGICEQCHNEIHPWMK